MVAQRARRDETFLLIWTSRVQDGKKNQHDNIQPGLKGKVKQSRMKGGEFCKENSRYHNADQRNGCKLCPFIEQNKEAANDFNGCHKEHHVQRIRKLQTDECLAEFAAGQLQQPRDEKYIGDGVPNPGKRRLRHEHMRFPLSILCVRLLHMYDGRGQTIPLIDIVR